MERIGSESIMMSVVENAGEEPTPISVPDSDFGKAVDFLLGWLGEQSWFPSVGAVGHRVVHGMNHDKPARITPDLLAELRGIVPLDPDHMPQETMLIESIMNRHPGLTQVACFDTSFHHKMPRVAKLLPIPRRYSEQGVVRYGFHGISYSYLMEELGRIDPSAVGGRVILAHLGSGASLAAVRNGKSIDTSMGFTPASGLVMGTRSGDLDPGLFSYLARKEKMTAARFQEMVNKESGLLGISETSSDLRDLLAVEVEDVRAADAVNLFCYQAKKWIGSFAAGLGGLDTLIFSGGIGENSSVVRQRICDGLEFLGVKIDGKRNAGNEAVISRDGGNVCIRVIPTNEELMIARSVSGFH